jgi:hypothetical protein
MARYLDKATRSYTGSSSDSTPYSGKDERRFLYELSADGLPQLVLVQRLGESEDGNSTVWQNYKLVYHDVVPDRVNRITLDLSSSPSGKPNGINQETQLFSENGIEISGYYYNFNSSSYTSRSNLSLDRASSTISLQSYYEEGSPVYTSEKFYFDNGGSKLRSGSPNGVVAADFSVGGDQVSGFLLNINTYAPHFNATSNGTDYAQFSNFGGEFEEIIGRNIALDLLGWHGDGFSESLYNAALNIINPQVFKSGLMGLMPTSQTSRSSDFQSTRGWTYENQYPIGHVEYFTGSYDYNGASIAYVNTNNITSAYVDSPTLISNYLKNSELSQLRSSIDYANLNFLTPNGQLAIAVDLLPKTAVTIAYSWQSNLLDLASSLLGFSPAGAPVSEDISDMFLMDVAASSWSGKVRPNRVANKVNDPDGSIWAKQIEFGTGQYSGSILIGTSGNDVLRGMAGWDIINGGDGDDLIRAGNGRDIITGGRGADELHGDFGWNTFTSERDDFVDTIVIKSDQYLFNWLLGKAENNSDGSKCDIIEGLDTFDKIKIVGVSTADIRIQAGITAQGLSGIGIYAKDSLEALYTGNDLSVDLLRQMVSGEL